MAVTALGNAVRKRKQSNVLPVRVNPPFPAHAQYFLPQTSAGRPCSHTLMQRETAQP